jgi:LacI family transcriptional regulator
MTERSHHRPTLGTVAREAGVSLATASKVLNGRPGVSQATRERVKAAIEKLRYSPTTGEPGFPRFGTRRPAINIVFDAVEAAYSVELLQGFLEAAQGTGMQVMVGLASPPDTDEDLDTWAHDLLSEGRMGTVFVTCELTPHQIAACERVGLPVVSIDSHTMLDAGVVTVGSSNFAGGQAATRHLIELGHRRIGLICGAPASSFAVERLHGFRAAMTDAGLPVDPALIRSGDFDYETGLVEGGGLLDLVDPPTGIVANCDAAAVGVLQAARLRNVVVPRDLSVVGFDDTRQARWSAPPLTTIRQPLSEIARVAVRAVVQLAEGRRPYSHHMQLATSLVVRESTAPPRKRPQTPRS